MTTTKLLITTICLTVAIACFPTKKQTEANKPNIIVLLVDDAGFADFGFMGSEDLETPNIDRLATQGVIFSDAHVSATVCGPSRAGIMTGRYQQRFGFECNPPSDSCGVDLNEVSLASALKKEGYTTAAFGKWHLGDRQGYRPNERGFDYFWGFHAGSRSYFPNKENDRKGDSRAIHENFEHVTFNGYLTDILGEKAAEFIKGTHKNPFFIYWAPNAVHTPMEATVEDMKKFEGHPRQKLAAMTWALDRAVGVIINTLEKEGILDNTVIFFLSDNGGSPQNMSSNFPLKGFKGNKFEGGHRVPFFVVWGDKIKGGKTYDGLTSALDIYATSLDVAGAKLPMKRPLDGVSLIPFLNDEQQGNPHERLFWRKDQMAAARIDSMKIIRVSRLQPVMYNLVMDLEETHDLATSEPERLGQLKNKLENWEEDMVKPLWTEREVWDTITWMIHQDLMNNQPVRVKNPAELKRYRSNKKH